MKFGEKSHLLSAERKIFKSLGGATTNSSDSSIRDETDLSQIHYDSLTIEEPLR